MLSPTYWSSLVSSYRLPTFPPKFLVSWSPVVAVIPDERQPHERWSPHHPETVFLASVPPQTSALLPASLGADAWSSLPSPPPLHQLALELHPGPVRTVTFMLVLRLSRCMEASYPSALSSHATSPQRLPVATLPRAATPVLGAGSCCPVCFLPRPCSYLPTCWSYRFASFFM